MEIAYNDRNIVEFMKIINMTEQEHPILVDKYLMGREVEVDGVFDGEDILIPGVMEHVERAGVHSGDSISVYPPLHIEEKHKQTILQYTYDLAKALGVIGLINIQSSCTTTWCTSRGHQRSSRTSLYLKVNRVPSSTWPPRFMLGRREGLGYGTALPRGPLFA
jgi:carbamoyl-phosphate synthase large subunit